MLLEIDLLLLLKKRKINKKKYVRENKKFKGI